MNVVTLREICDDVIADRSLEPRNGQTFCNEGARRVAQAMDCHDFDDESLLADDMIAIMNSGGAWQLVEGQDAADHAQLGGLAFACLSSHQLGEAHGHIAALYPADMEYSGSLARMVPMVANVGKQDREEKVSAAFPVSKGEPQYYVWG